MLVFSQQTNGAFSDWPSDLPARRRPAAAPPHREDEVFSVISGRFELFNGEDNTWTEIPKDQVVFAPRNHVHTFRNCGDTVGTIQFISSGNTFDVFLEGLAAYEVPKDMQAMIDYTASFDIFYPTLPPPTLKA